jgi:hypothetical protein
MNRWNSLFILYRTYCRELRPACAPLHMHLRRINQYELSDNYGAPHGNSLQLEVRRAWELENGTILRIPDSEDQEVSQIRIALIARARNFRFSDIQFEFRYRASCDTKKMNRPAAAAKSHADPQVRDTRVSGPRAPC